MAKTALIDLGFESKEIVELKNRQNSDLKEGLLVDFSKMLKSMSANLEENASILLIVLFKGHGVDKDGSLHAVDNNDDDSFDLEKFVQDCSSLPGIYTISLYDCCRREVKNEDHLSVANQKVKNLVTVYREPPSEYLEAGGCTCDPLQTPSLIEAFFDHLETKS